MYEEELERHRRNPMFTLAGELEHDRIVAKRGKPGMPRLDFMNGTKWGKTHFVGDGDEPESRAA